MPDNRIVHLGPKRSGAVIRAIATRTIQITDQGNSGQDNRDHGNTAPGNRGATRVTVARITQTMATQPRVIGERPG